MHGASLALAFTQYAVVLTYAFCGYEYDKVVFSVTIDLQYHSLGVEAGFSDNLQGFV